MPKSSYEHIQTFIIEIKPRFEVRFIPHNILCVLLIEYDDNSKLIHVIYLTDVL